jgi:hypothetical protein
MNVPKPWAKEVLDHPYHVSSLSCAANNHCLHICLKLLDQQKVKKQYLRHMAEKQNNFPPMYQQNILFLIVLTVTLAQLS